MNDSRISLLDLGITHIESNARNYTIDSLIGKGGSSLVYKAYYVLNGYYKIVLIKELLPLELYSKGKISRDTKGVVCVDEDCVNRYNQYISIAETEQNTINELRFIEEIKNNEPYFFDQVDCFRANNTLYSVLATESGDTLLSLLHEKEIQNTKKWPEDLQDVCQIVLRILEALEPIHSRNKLHLDISPDNIFFSKMAVNDNRIARMIDFNSIIDLNDVNKGQNRFSYKEGYSALELSGMMRFSSKKISFSTDLYSVAAVMFRILKGATTSSFSMHRTEYWKIDDNNSYCNNAPESAIDLCNKILRKGLSPMQKQRYQNIAEMKSDIKNLYELCVQTPYLIKSNIDFSMLPTNIYGREQALKKLEQDLLDRKKVILSGVGGIGKTTLAIAYAKEHTKAYKKIIFLHFYKTVVETIIDDSNFPIYGITRVKNESDEDYYNRKLNAFRKIIDDDVLLILDGFDQIDNEISNLLTLPCKIIITSRIDYTIYGVQDFKIDSIAKAEALIMFKQISNISDSSDCEIVHLLEIVEYHTLTVELLARQVAFTDITVDKLIENLNDGGLVELDTEKVGSAKDRTLSFETIINHIEKLFSLDTLSENERRLIYKMSLFSDIGISKDAFNSFNESGVDSIMKHLITLGWVQYSSDNEEFKMHPVTAEAARKRNLSENYYFDRFVDKCNSWMSAQCAWDQWIVDKKIKLQEQLIKKYNYLSSELKMKVLVDSIDLLRRVNKAFKASEYVVLALSLYKESEECFSDGLCGAMFNNIGLLDLEFGDYDNAVEHLTAAAKHMNSELSEIKYFKDSDRMYESYALILCNIGYTLTLTGEYDKAKSHFQLAAKTALSIDNEIMKAKCWALIFKNEAYVSYYSGNKEEAFDLLEKSSQNAMLDLPNNAEIYVSDFRMMSEILCELKEYEAAEETAKMAIKATDDMIDNDSETIKSCEALAKVYLKQGEYSKSYDEYGKAFQLIKSTKFFSSLFLIRFYNDFAFVCENLKDYNKAVSLIKHTLVILYGTNYLNLSTEELISKTKEALIKYKNIAICKIFINIIKYHFITHDNETAEIFYMLLHINNEYLDNYANLWIKKFKEKYLKNESET